MTYEKNAVCQAWRPITWSRKDTEQTILEVKENNLGHKEWCKP